MKHLPLVALLFAAALGAITLVVVPSCIGPFFETPPDWKLQRQTLRQSAAETVRKYEVMYGDTPVEEWPEERHRLTYTNAKRILDKMDGKS